MRLGKTGGDGYRQPTLEKAHIQRATVAAYFKLGI